MPDLQPPRLENFIPRDPLDHICILRRNFAKIDCYVKESPAGTVPNYLYNVLSQQFEALSEKLLLPPTEGGQLTSVVLQARVHAAAHLDCVHEEEVEGAKDDLADVGGQGEVAQDEELFRAEDESSRYRGDGVGGPSPSDKDAVHISSPTLTPSQPREEVAGVPSHDLTSIQPGEEVIVVANSDSVPSPLREEAVKTHVEAYGVQMQNVRPNLMHIRTRGENFEVRKGLIAENGVRIASIHRCRDIKYLEWVGHDAPIKEQGAILLEFRTPEQANDVIRIGLKWRGIEHLSRKFPRNCDPTQCNRCQVYGHREKQCASLPRCQICSGQHITSRCSSETPRCALCGGSHRANSPLCATLAAEIDRVRHAALDQSLFWPVNDTVKETSGAAQTVGATAPAGWQPWDSTTSEKLAPWRLDFASPQRRSALESRKTKKALKAASAEAYRKRKENEMSTSPSTRQEGKKGNDVTRNPSSSPHKPATASTIDPWSEFATDDAKVCW